MGLLHQLDLVLVGAADEADPVVGLLAEEGL